MGSASVRLRFRSNDSLALRQMPLPVLPQLPLESSSTAAAAVTHGIVGDGRRPPAVVEAGAAAARPVLVVVGSPLARSDIVVVGAAGRRFFTHTSSRPYAPLHDSGLPSQSHVRVYYRSQRRSSRKPRKQRVSESQSVAVGSGSFKLRWPSHTATDQTRCRRKFCTGRPLFFFFSPACMKMGKWRSFFPRNWPPMW